MDIINSNNFRLFMEIEVTDQTKLIIITVSIIISLSIVAFTGYILLKGNWHDNRADNELNKKDNKKPPSQDETR
jgi:hypothetical protein